MDGNEPQEKIPELFISSKEFFNELVEEACQKRSVETFPQVTGYLVDMLVFFVNTDNLYDDEDLSGRKTRKTLAEMFLKAGNAQRGVRLGLLKRLGDTALYVSGFFGESLQRQTVDLDYYKEMGETAYDNLSKSVNEDLSARVYREFSQKFVQFVDILTYISAKAIRPAENNLLQVFERYVTTGSELARDQLLNQGLITVPNTGKKTYQQ